MTRPSTIDEYMRAVPPEFRRLLQNLRRTIKSVVPAGTVESLSYSMPAFRYGKGRPLVYYAAFRDHCSLFPASGSTLKAFAKELEGFQTSRGTVQFTLKKPLPAALVKKIVKARVKEVQRKGKDPYL